MGQFDGTGQFDGRVAFVTGAASGVGRATVTRLVAEGAQVFGVDINHVGLDEVGSELGDAFEGRTADIRSREVSHEAVAAAVERFGRLDVVANVAGMFRMNHMTEVSQEEWDTMMRVNVEGMFWVSQAAIPHLLESAGNIVNVASNAGLMGQAYTVAYCATKGAVVNMTKAMAMEYIKTDIRVNAVAPGGMVTGMTSTMSLPEDLDFDLMATYTGFRGMAEPDTCANAIVWLASDEAARCTGTILSIDGGLTAA